MVINGEPLQEEDENFVIDTPEDYFAYEEMVLLDRSKCRKKGKKKRDKFVIPGKDKKEPKDVLEKEEDTSGEKDGR